MSTLCRLLRVYGENEILYMRHIMYNTCRRSLRWKIIHHLSHTLDGEFRVPNLSLGLAKC